MAYSYAPIVDASDDNLLFSDLTTNNVSTTRHGFFPKLPGGTTNFLEKMAHGNLPVAVRQHGEALRELLLIKQIYNLFWIQNKIVF